MNSVERIQSKKACYEAESVLRSCHPVGSKTKKETEQRCRMHSVGASFDAERLSSMIHPNFFRGIVDTPKRLASPTTPRDIVSRNGKLHTTLVARQLEILLHCIHIDQLQMGHSPGCAGSSNTTLSVFTFSECERYGSEIAF
jgi:hypothetical protein